ncbi:phage capsid protein [Veillonella criceti]|uniref:P22 coat protein - gene protein 5 n=1 Tax=Veillonella criceti TaxID=103891 RepID=A0A380NJK4_9FIRM|nr:phage capsid protein [Veillonella criceti]SUP42256.1 P22 coat protein - gene protein 5 [Veillonella criceti]
MAISNFIPTLWEGRLLAHLDKNLVFANLCNRDYEGDITSQGDRVKINQIGDITVKDYKKNTDIAVEAIDGEQIELIIDQSKYYAFGVEDIDKAQANVELVDRAMERAAYALADTVDRFIASMHKEAKIKVGDDTTPIVITPESAYENLVDLKTALDDENVPRTGRFAVVPSWFEGMMLKDARFVAAGTTATDDKLANGFIGKAAGFDLYTSNNIVSTAGGKYKILAGNSSAISFAQQLVETEALRQEKRFADLIRGLLVFGAKVVQPKALACLTANNK